MIQHFTHTVLVKTCSKPTPGGALLLTSIPPNAGGTPAMDYHPIWERGRDRNTLTTLLHV